MTLTGKNAITMRKLTSKVTAEKSIPPLIIVNDDQMVSDVREASPFGKSDHIQRVSIKVHQSNETY